MRIQQPNRLCRRNAAAVRLCRESLRQPVAYLQSTSRVLPEYSNRACATCMPCPIALHLRLPLHLHLHLHLRLRSVVPPHFGIAPQGMLCLVDVYWLCRAVQRRDHRRTAMRRLPNGLENASNVHVGALCGTGLRLRQLFDHRRCATGQNVAGSGRDLLHSNVLLFRAGYAGRTELHSKADSVH